MRKKYLTVAIAASCILGVCLGVALTCALAVIFKTCGINVHWAVYIPVALALSAGSAVPFFLLLRPDDKRIAKKLDKDFSLNQKVQTMVEFANVEGDIHVLQREQADEALGAVAKKRVDLKWLLKFSFIPVIAAAMLFAGIFVPAKKAAEYVPPPFTATPAHKVALESLIEDVEEKSSLDTGLKAFIGLELRGLVDMLEEAEYQSTMKGAVISAVHNIDSLIADTNTYLKIDAELKVEEVLQPFSAAVVNGVVNYKNYSNLTSMRMVGEREADAEDRIESVLEIWKSSYLAEYAPKADGATVGTPLPVEQAAIKLEDFADALIASLEEYAAQLESQPALFAEDGESDALYDCLTALAEKLKEHAVSGSGNDTLYYNNIDGYLTGFITGAKVPLAKQSYNCMMDDYLRNALSRIFGISRSEFGSNAHVAPSPTQSEKDPSGGKEETNGGYGDGKHEYGSNDEILDPDSGEKKKYGDLIDPSNENGGTFYDKYYNRAMEYLNDPDKSPPPEVAAYIRQYFTYLNNGMDDKKD